MITYKIHTLVFDFDGVFTNGNVYLNQDGIETVRCCRQDGFGFDLLRKYKQKNGLGLDVFILSKEANQVVQRRAEKLKLKCINGIDDKFTVLSHYFAENRPEDSNPFAGLAYVGNDLNDLQVMLSAKYAFAPNDAHTAIQSIATEVMPFPGGNGCVRAVIEKLLGIDKMGTDELLELLS